ncbi:MAG: hypothetical protein A3K03_03575 [Bdellovibrionales bacterium RIFOXYD1_FULL_44_7]|nr:MAG: hypothetical protein A3K03_03575 [Bdellovibrionales bacterium RIFOXYD1_FULL_44_7]
MKRLLVFLVLLFASESAWCYNCFNEGFLPRNDLKIPADQLLSEIDEPKFNEIIDKIENHYRPIVSNSGGRLIIQRLWRDETVNASAERIGQEWRINMYGGLARHPLITSDAFALVTCHEMGHHVGGVPKYRNLWPSNEGQSDYFANLKCLRRIFENDNNEEIVKNMAIDAKVITHCNQNFNDINSAAICMRSAMAGLSTARLSQSLSGGAQVDFNTPDTSAVAQTFDDHPAPQCRLDTYFNGSKCPVHFSENLSGTDPNVGTCSNENGLTDGVRPLCWYRPSNSSNPPSADDIAETPTIAGYANAVVTNPYVSIPIDYNVSNFRLARGVYLEVSRPNQLFLEPNGYNPDSFRLVWATQAGTVGRFFLTPVQSLSGYGVYSIRVIPLDYSGRYPVARFSHSAFLDFRPF